MFCLLLQTIRITQESKSSLEIWIPGIIGIVGAIIGAYATYKFQKWNTLRLEKQKLKREFIFLIKNIKENRTYTSLGIILFLSLSISIRYNDFNVFMRVYSLLII